MSRQPLPAKAYKESLSDEPVLSESERQTASFLGIETDDAGAELLRKMLLAAGFEHVSVCSSYHQALVLMTERSFSHVIFASETRDKLSAEDFLKTALGREEDAFFIVATGEIQTDRAFELLRVGARGFIIRPYSADSLDEVVTTVTKGEPMSRAILDSPNRNQAFAKVVSKSLDNAADKYRGAERTPASKAEYDKAMSSFRDASKAAKTFAETGVDALLEVFVDFFSQLSSGPATDLGRLRERLKRRRLGSKGAEAQGDSEEKKSS